MIWLQSLLIGVLTGAFSLLGSGLLAGACVTWYHITSREGYSGYFIGFFALLGGCVGGAIGFLTTLGVMTGGQGTAWRGLMYSVGISTVSLSVVAAACWLLADHAPTDLPSVDWEEAERQTQLDRLEQEEDAFVRIDEDAPLAELLPFLEKEMQQERALKRILARPQLVDEVKQLAFQEDSDGAAKALLLIPQMPSISCQFESHLVDVANDIVRRLDAVNNTSVDEDPGYVGAADVSVRFSAWMAAIRSLHERCRSDFTQELENILQRSRHRTDSIAIREDVCRVASFYLHEWAGVPPLPSDPPPR